MLSSIRHIRAAVFVVVGAFCVVGPAYHELLDGPSYNGQRPWIPMAWHMYHSVGTDMCQAQFFAEHDGAPVELAQPVLQKAIGRVRGHGKYGVGRKVRANDVLFSGEVELPDISRALCKSEPDIRAYVRCAPPMPGGDWRVVQTGEENLCTKSWTPPKVVPTGPAESD